MNKTRLKFSLPLKAEWTFNIDENAKDIFINRSKLSTNIFILGEVLEVNLANHV